MRNNFDVSTIEVVLAPSAFGIVADVGNDRIVLDCRVIFRWYRYLLLISVPGMVSPASSICSSLISAGSPSKSGSAKRRVALAGVVDNVEEKLYHTRLFNRVPSADDLLELRHGADHARQHDVLAGGEHRLPSLAFGM